MWKLKDDEWWSYQVSLERDDKLKSDKTTTNKVNYKNALDQQMKIKEEMR